MIVFFDLDGPLLDVSRRYVVLHQELLVGLGAAAMDAERYWTAKRARRTEHDILAELNALHLLETYSPARLARIETMEALVHDRCWPWSLETLEHIAQHATLVMVTARAHRPALLDQLDRLLLRPHFHEILSEPGNDRVDLQKAALIRDYVARHGHCGEGHWMIGDTEADVAAGKLAGLQTIAVLSGIRDEHHLRAAGADYLVPDIRAVPAILKLPPKKDVTAATSS